MYAFRVGRPEDRHVAILFNDITERKQAQEEIETLLRTTIDGYYLVDRDGRFLDTNDSYCQMIGYGRDELLKMGVKDIEAIDSDEVIRARIQRIVETGYARFETRHRRKDGREIDIEASVNLLGGRRDKLVVFMRDITERKQAERSLRDLLLQLSRAEDVERRRIGRELHDSTGQKLAALSMTVGLLQDTTGAPTGTARKMFADCTALVEQCAQEIRTFSYLLHPPLLDELGLAAAISDYIDGFTKRSGVQVALDAPPGVERLSDEIEIALFRVVQEGLANVHRHSGTSTARILLSADAEQVMLEVRDQGRGMSPEIVRAIQRKRGDTSVGIAGMRERLRLLGGRLEIESDAQGTTVRATIPRRQEPT
ncbi:MAG: PAS domain-containing sensor histidine kinase [Acidobacteria bacterium]|nr:PAS domain-containing sensor histidine kinase [Acidobacteriota bacterium]